MILLVVIWVGFDVAPGWTHWSLCLRSQHYQEGLLDGTYFLSYFSIGLCHFKRALYPLFFFFFIRKSEALLILFRGGWKAKKGGRGWCVTGLVEPARRGDDLPNSHQKSPTWTQTKSWIAYRNHRPRYVAIIYYQARGKDNLLTFYPHSQYTIQLNVD